MKFFRRCLLCVLSLCLCLGAFSVSASAEEIDVPNYHVFVQAFSYLPGGAVAERSFTPGNGVNEGTWWSRDLPSTHFFFGVTTYITADSKLSFVKKGKTATITIENIRDEFVYGSNHVYGASGYSGYVIYEDGSVTYVNPEKTTKEDGYNIRFTVTAEKNIVSLVWHGVYDLQTSGIHTELYLGEGSDSKNEYKVTVDIQDPNTGLLENISSAISNGVVSGIANLGNKITEVFNAIVDLPATIWGFIENGLKNLFVPDEQYLLDYQDNWDSLLEDRFGAIYQVVNLTIESWERIETADAQNTISMPEVSIDLPDNVEYSFGGYDVQIVPSGFEFVADALKMITGIACSILFINGLRKRYDSIMTR